MKLNAPGVTRTRGPRIRNPVLYPPELRGHTVKSISYRAFASESTFRVNTLLTFLSPETTLRSLSSDGLL